MHARADTCIGGLHEVGVGVSDLERAIKDFTAYGCHLLERGRLDAQAAQQLYGVTSAVDSVRLGHLDSDHGLIHLMQW